MSDTANIDEKVKKQLEKLEEKAITRYTDYFDEVSQQEVDNYDKKELVNEFLNNNELEKYYNLLEPDKKQQKFHSE